MDREILDLENKYLEKTIDLVNVRIEELRDIDNRNLSIFNESNAEYLKFLSDNSNRINESSAFEISNMQNKLEDLQTDSGENQKEFNAYNKMLDKPYFARIDIQERHNPNQEKYYIGIHSLIDENKEFRVVDWRSPIASIFYDYEQGPCQIRTNSSILNCDLKNKRQFGITKGKLDYYIDTTINIEDNLLQEALAKSTNNQMKTIVQTIQKEQNSIIRGDENKTLVVQGVAGSGKTAIALHRIAYLLYKMKGKIKSENIQFISPNNAFSSYISSVLPDLAENDIEKVQLDQIARKQLKKHLILERKFEQMERLIGSRDISDYNYKTSYKFLVELLNFAKTNYIDNFDIKEMNVRDTDIDCDKIKELFFGRYSDRDLFTRFKWITDNIFDKYFYKVKTPEKVVRLKEIIFKKLYDCIDNKNCVRAYMNFLNSKKMKLELVGDKVKNEDAYAILLLKIFIYGIEKSSTIKHLIIDEMQDYSPIQLHIINSIYDCTKTILGDFNQTINPDNVYNTMKSYSSILSNDLQVLTLEKSYRSTEQIANFYNKIGNKNNAKVVSRQGEKVDLITINENQIETIIKLIEEYKSKGFVSIALITKTNSEAQLLYSKLENNIDNITLIDDNTDAYNNEICVISAYNSKGLEFDAVIIYDVSDNYITEIDRNLLYIAATRALHKLSIISIGKQSNLLLDLEEK